MKILHLADEHIRDKDIDEIAICLNHIVTVAQQEQPDLIISAGDLFDSQDVRMGSRSALAAIGFISALADIAPVAIIKGTSSHDGNSPEILRFARGIFPIHVATMPEQVFLYESGFRDGDMQDGSMSVQAIIALIPQPTKQFFRSEAGVADSDQEIGQAMSALFAGFGASAAAYPGVPHILLYHGGISGAVLSSGQVRTGMEIEVSTDQMMMSGADLICCGHIHKPQQLGDRTFYSGSIYAENIGEDHEHGFWIHRIDHLEKVSRFTETPCKRTVRFKRDLTEDQPEPVYVDGVSGAHVRYELTTWQDEAGEIDKAGIERMLLEAGALSVDIRITRVPRVNIRAAAVLEADRLRDKLTKRAELVGETVDPVALEMADLLEGSVAEELLGMVMNGGAA